MVDFECKSRYTFADLVEVVRLLRGPGGCPWDAEQTHASIRRNFIEETCEACEAIDTANSELLCEELGDVLLQVLFHTDIEAEAGRFTLEDICDRETKKLIYRHPHVFGSVQASDTAQVLTNWDHLKRVEKGQKTNTDTLRAVSRALPSLWRAEKLQKKAEQAGIPAPDRSRCLRQLADDIQALNSSDSEALLGRLLFHAVALARALGQDPETAATAASDRFLQRFAELEQTTGAAQGEPLPPQLHDRLWSED